VRSTRADPEAGVDHIKRGDHTLDVSGCRVVPNGVHELVDDADAKHLELLVAEAEAAGSGTA
jgi:hypothetical protein